ncbi:hypothetical protein [Viscerimonas tarda]
MQKDNQIDNDLQSYFEQIKADLSNYILKRIELLKLQSYEKIAVSGSYIAYSLIILVLIFNIFFLFLLALGFFLGEYLHSYALGFGVLVLVSLVVLPIYALNAKRFRRFIANKVISVIRKIEKDEE